ncbi:MAG: hypothetical protein ACFFDW_15375, partial [Candidatus Thorarchaeota archaeon]
MVNKLSELLANTVKIKCKLCNHEIVFDVEDENTFISKTLHQDFFGMRLITYRVQHVVNEERHLNAVLIDHKNLFRGHVDAYNVPLHEEEQSPVNNNEYMLLEEEIEIPISNKLIANFFIASLDGWILEVVKIPKSKTVAILKNIYEKIEESKKIYEIIPQPLNVLVADLECSVWVEGRTYII